MATAVNYEQINQKDTRYSNFNVTKNEKNYAFSQLIHLKLESNPQSKYFEHDDENT